MPEAVLIAVVQGLTEFLPVSSSGHMVLAKSLLGVKTPGTEWEVALHLGTLAAVVILLRNEVIGTAVGFARGLREACRRRSWRPVWKADPEFRFGCYVVLGTIPAGVVGALLHGAIEGLFSSGLAAMAFLFLTGEVLWLTRHHSVFPSKGELRWSDSLIIGLAQACALLPGISRSGTTIAAGIMRGVDRVRATQFSFLLSVPAILGAALLDIGKISSWPRGHLSVLIVGAVVAGVVGYGALRLLFRLVRRGQIHWFAYYCWTVSIVGFTICWGMGRT